jgi:glycosyltransferase involved in cell wall biosynthesis
VARILAAADVFVLSSDREGLPIAVLEAMAAAKPVIATAVGDLPSVVGDGVTGRIVAPGDRAALAEAMIELLDDRARAAEMGAKAAQAARERYSVGAMLGKYLKLFDRR